MNISDINVRFYLNFRPVGEDWGPCSRWTQANPRLQRDPPNPGEVLIWRDLRVIF
jgi:hypothetical protein